MILAHQHFDLLEKVVLEHVIFQPPLKANGSMHDEACLLYSINGESILYGETEKNGLKSKEGVIMKCGSYINDWLPSDDNEPYEAVAVHFCPEVLKYVYEDKLPEFLRIGPKSNLNSITSVKSSELLTKYIQSLIFYFENPELVTPDLIALKVKEIIILLVNTDSSENIKRILQDLFNPQDSTFRDRIEQHIFHDLSLEDLAVLCNMSLSSFKRKFKEVFNNSPAKYIKVKRLEKARELILKTNKRIAEIAFECGFHDPAHFSKSFMTYFKQAPSQLKKS